ncbi:acetylglutamate kinase [Paenactinomyces guangxiensis]|uniref:Acetylglutamate kinase n=1 Tax=Paenactinomyces guangxiensis TaxID=1490290 RepID=A0A7W2A952_9BACL|nr:acetylglutamate kinase [Paenactinomyces guangxiensis]MBA4495350.1 acetylglutamate kinase [Paenactinomyces guangxiensis]MBH8592529.1 acetylglutamate kinase [Paenactinomyces guangxiensis]
MTQTIVVKLGGSILRRLHPTFYSRCAELQRKGVTPIIVHGGGPMISEWMKATGKAPKFVDGLRVTDEETLAIVEMVLAGSVNKQIVTCFLSEGADAVGLSGIDLQLLQTEQRNPVLGYVGEVISVNDKAIRQLLDQGWIPVISSLGIDDRGQHLNINADEAASAIARAVGAKQLVMVSDVDGISIGEGDDKHILSQATPELIEQYIHSGEITGGMIPKVRSGIRCLEGSVEEVWIVNGEKPDSLMLDSANRDCGTCLVKKEAEKDVALSHISSS